MATKVKDVTVDGVTTPVFVTDAGEFTTYEGGAPRFGEAPLLKAPTLKALTDKLKTQVRQRRLAIPVTRIEEGWSGRRERELEVVRCTLTGIHEGNRNLLYKRADGTSDQARYSGEFYRPLTPEETAEAKRLYAAIYDARQVWEEWKAERSVNALTLIQEAATAPTPPAPTAAEPVES